MSKSERIKLDNRLRLLIENGVKTNQRSIVCLVGEQGRNQVVHIHNILSKANVKGKGLKIVCWTELDSIWLDSSVYWFKVIETKL